MLNMTIIFSNLLHPMREPSLKSPNKIMPLSLRNLVVLTSYTLNVYNGDRQIELNERLYPSQDIDKISC